MLHRERLERRERGRFFGVGWFLLVVSGWVGEVGMLHRERLERRKRGRWGGGGDEGSGWFLGIWNWV
jgi:hypothetical protein